MAAIFLFWIFLAVMLGIWVNGRGRNGYLASFLALVLSPLVIWIVHLAIGRGSGEPYVDPALQGDDVGQSLGGNVYRGPLPASEMPAPTHKRCPACAEEILVEAKKCKHCGEWIEPQPQP